MSRRVAALVPALVALLLAAGVGAGPAAAAATPTPAPASPGPAAAPVVLGVTDLLPRAPGPGDVLTVTGTLTNSGPDALQGVAVHVEVGARLATRGELRQADTGKVTYRDRASVPVPALAAGATVPVTVQVPVDDLRLAAAGVYPLRLEVRATRGGAARAVGQVSTYLPWTAGGTVDPVRLAWVWPLVDVPHQGSDDVLVDDALAADLGPTGRLGRSLSLARSGEAAAVPVTYAVDPDLLQTAEAMTGSYRVAAPGGTRDGTGSAAAQSWLSTLRSASGDVLALPFADPDVVALTRGSADLGADVGAARAYGDSVTRDVLGRAPLEDVALPPPGRLSAAAYDAVTTGGTTALVLGEDAVSAPQADARSTPGSRVVLPPSATAGAVTGLVVDRGLSDLLGAGGTGGPRLAEQRWLAETAMVSAELPSRGRTLVVALPRRGDPDAAVVGAALADTARLPWVCPVALAQVVAATERCPGATTAPAVTPERAVDLLQPDPRTPSLSPEYVADVSAVRGQARQLVDAVVQGGTDPSQALRARLQRAWLRTESSAWRDDRDVGARLLGRLRDEVGGLRNRVTVVTGQPITLTSGNGRVSVLVVNDLDQPVTVAVVLKASSDARLSQRQTDVLVVPPHQGLPVAVDATTSTSGRFVVKAQLLDREGSAFGAPADLLVRSTRYGTVALAVTGFGAAVLLVAAGARLVRRALRQARA